MKVAPIAMWRGASASTGAGMAIGLPAAFAAVADTLIGAAFTSVCWALPK
jgi:hypothetical protein